MPAASIQWLGQATSIFEELAKDFDGTDFDDERFARHVMVDSVQKPVEDLVIRRLCDRLSAVLEISQVELAKRLAVERNQFRRWRQGSSPQLSNFLCAGLYFKTSIPFVDEDYTLWVVGAEILPKLKTQFLGGSPEHMTAIDFGAVHLFISDGESFEASENNIQKAANVFGRVIHQLSQVLGDDRIETASVRLAVRNWWKPYLVFLRAMDLLNWDILDEPH